MGPGDSERQRQRGRIREEDRGDEGVTVKGKPSCEGLGLIYSCPELSYGYNDSTMTD